MSTYIGLTCSPAGGGADPIFPGSALQKKEVARRVSRVQYSRRAHKLSIKDVTTDCEGEVVTDVM